MNSLKSFLLNFRLNNYEMVSSAAFRAATQKASRLRLRLRSLSEEEIQERSINSVAKFNGSHWYLDIQEGKSEIDTYIQLLHTIIFGLE